MKKILIIIILARISAFGFSEKPPAIEPVVEFQREVAVQLFHGAEVSINVHGKAVLECYRDSKLAEVYYFSPDIRLVFRKNGIEVYDDNGLISGGLIEIRCKPRNDVSVLIIQGKSYRGYFRVIAGESSGEMIALNIVDLDDYLMGVLPSEIGDREKNEYEAAKAQAVAARTYAIWKMNVDGSSGRLFPTIADQVYAGKDSEIDILSMAVRETAGELMFFENRPLAAYYHAVCGGHTISIQEAWPDKDPQPFLTGADDDDYCKWAKTFSWTETFTGGILKANLLRYFTERKQAGDRDFDFIDDILFFMDEGSGRAIRMDVVCNGGVFSVEKDQIRWALGRPSKPGSILPSTMFRFEKLKSENGLDELVITGTGNGHGVGACQCGIIGRARAGQKYKDILKTYYNGAEIIKVY